MNEIRDQTRVTDMAMDDGSNAGKELAPVRGQRLTVAQEREIGRQKLVGAVESRQAEIGAFLKPFGVSWDFFLSCLKVALMKTIREDGEFFSMVTPASFLEAVLRCAMNGLLPDGKDAAIARFKDQATCMIMRDGLVKVLHRTGMIKDINDAVVVAREEELGRFEYEEGSAGYIKHRPLLDRDEANDVIVAAYCVIHTVNGGEFREVVPKADLDKIAKVSRATKGPRVDWRIEMARKAAIRRIVKRMPKDEGLVRVLAHDEDAYDLALIDAQPKVAVIPKAVLFSNKAAVRANAPAAPQGEPVAAESPTAEQEEPKAQSAVLRLVTAMLHAEDLGTLAELAHEAQDLECDEEEHQWVRETLDAARVRLMPTVEEIEAEFTEDAKVTATETVHPMSVGDVSGPFATAAESPDPLADAASPASDAGTATEPGTHGSGDTTATQDADKPVLRALITSGMAVKEYADEKEWSGAILGKLASVSGDRMASFWKANSAYVHEAKAAGAQEAFRVLKQAASRGLNVERDE